MGTHPIFESDFDCLTERNMSDISNTNGAGDAENVAKDKLEIKKLVQQLDEINVSNGATDIERNTEKQRPTVVTRGIEGRIKWFNIPRGYGFIERLDEQPDVFVHQSAVVRPGRKPRFSLYLKGGEQVEFDVVQGLKGLEAAAVTAPGGYELASATQVHFKRHYHYQHRRGGQHVHPNHNHQKPRFNKNKQQQQQQTDENANEVVVAVDDEMKQEQQQQ